MAMLRLALALYYLISVSNAGYAKKKFVTGAQFFGDTMIKGMILGFNRVIPDQVEIPDLNLHIEHGCSGILKGSGGVVKGLRSLKSFPLKYFSDDQGALYISLPLHFTDLHIVYPQFYFNCWPFEKKGSADLLLKTNKVTITVQMSSYSTFVDKIVKKDCVFSVNSIKVSDVGEVESNIETDGLTGGFLTSILFPFVAVQTKKDVLEKMSLKVTNKISNALPAGSFWICRDENLEAIIEETGGHDDTTVPDIEALKDLPAQANES